MIPWSCKAISKAGFVAVNTMGVSSNESCLFKWNEFLRNYGNLAKDPMKNARKIKSFYDKCRKIKKVPMKNKESRQKFL